MSGFFDRMLGRGKGSSASKAKERLQFVLIHDRINISPERLTAMKQEILAVISKYVAISGDDVDIALEQRDRNSSVILAEIPFSKSIDPPEDHALPVDDTGAVLEENERTIELDEPDNEAAASTGSGEDVVDAPSQSAGDDEQSDNDKS
jgi:cell division topological specificity factor